MSSTNTEVLGSLLQLGSALKSDNLNINSVETLLQLGEVLKNKNIVTHAKKIVGLIRSLPPELVEPVEALVEQYDTSGKLKSIIKGAKMLNILPKSQPVVPLITDQNTEEEKEA